MQFSCQQLGPICFLKNTLQKIYTESTLDFQIFWKINLFKENSKPLHCGEEQFAVKKIEKQ